MKSIKVIISTILLFVVTSGANAAGGIKLCVKLKSTDKIEEYLLGEKKPVVTFDGQNVCIKTIGVEIVTHYAYADVERMFFNVVNEDVTPDHGDEDINVGIEKLQDDSKEKVGFEFAYDGRSVVMKGLGEAPKVDVFNMSGVRMQPHTEITSDRVAISMYELPKGIYVIRANNRSFKIIKK